jgi:hypothetical protein
MVVVAGNEYSTVVHHPNGPVEIEAQDKTVSYSDSVLTNYATSHRIFNSDVYSGSNSFKQTFVVGTKIGTRDTTTTSSNSSSESFSSKSYSTDWYYYVSTTAGVKVDYAKTTTQTYLTNIFSTTVYGTDTTTCEIGTKYTGTDTITYSTTISVYDTSTAYTTARVDDLFRLNHFIITKQSYYADRNYILVSVSSPDWIPISSCTTATSFEGWPELTTLTVSMISEGETVDTISATVNLIAGKITDSDYINGSTYTTTDYVGGFDYNEFSTFTQLSNNVINCFPMQTVTLDNPISLSSWLGGISFVNSTSAYPSISGSYSFTSPGYTFIYDIGGLDVGITSIETSASDYPIYAMPSTYFEFVEPPATNWSVIDKVSGARWISGNAEIIISDFPYADIIGRCVRMTIPFSTASVVSQTFNGTGFNSVDTSAWTTVNISFDQSSNCFSEWTWKDGSSVASSSGSMHLQEMESLTTSHSAIQFGIDLNGFGGNPAVNHTYTNFDSFGAFLITTGNSSTTGTYSTSYSIGTSHENILDGNISVISPVQMIKGFGVYEIPYDWNHNDIV